MESAGDGYRRRRAARLGEATPHRRTRTVRAGSIVAVLATFCLGAMTHAAWGGTRSTDTLGYREALQIMQDRSAPISRRQTAARSVYMVTIDAADIFEKSGPEIESYKGELETWQKHISEAWGK